MSSICHFICGWSCSLDRNAICDFLGPYLFYFYLTLKYRFFGKKSSVTADVIPFSIAQTHCYAFRLCDCLVRHLPMVDMRLLDRCFRGNILVSVFGASSSHCGPNPLSFKISSICFILAIVYYKKLLLSYTFCFFSGLSLSVS